MDKENADILKTKSLNVKKLLGEWSESNFSQLVEPDCLLSKLLKFGQGCGHVDGPLRVAEGRIDPVLERPETNPN